MKDQLRATLIIVSYGRPDLVLQLLDSIVQHTPEPHELLIIDNASKSAEARMITTHPSQPRVIEAPRNLGYGGGVNFGVRNSATETVVIMNSDLQVTPKWLSPLLAVIEQHTAAIAAPLYLDGDGNTIESGASITSDGHVLGSRTSGVGLKPVDHVSAACWAFNKQWFEAMGGFDPTYGLGYYEDVDLVNVARSRNERVVVVNDCAVIHHTGGTFDSEASRHLSHRNHARSLARWTWLYRGSGKTRCEGEAALSHGRVAVIGDHPDVVCELQEQNISVVAREDVAALRQRAHRDDVVVTKDRHGEARRAAPRAEITTPEGLWKALKRAGITPNTTPPKPLFSSITATRSRRW